MEVRLSNIHWLARNEPIFFFFILPLCIVELRTAKQGNNLNDRGENLRNLRKLEKCDKHSPMARVSLGTSLVFVKIITQQRGSDISLPLRAFYGHVIFISQHCRFPSMIRFSPKTINLWLTTSKEDGVSTEQAVTAHALILRNRTYLKPSKSRSKEINWYF